jgi:hypothetical protein
MSPIGVGLIGQKWIGQSPSILEGSLWMELHLLQDTTEKECLSKLRITTLRVVISDTKRLKLMSTDPTFISVSDEELAELDKPSPRKSSARGIDSSIRTVETWFKFTSHFGFCENPNCEDQRPRKVAEGNAAVVEISGTKMCRLCFVKGFKL